MYNIDFIPAPSPLQCLDICRIIEVVTRCSQQQQQQQCQAEGLQLTMRKDRQPWRKNTPIHHEFTSGKSLDLLPMFYYCLGF